MSTGLAAVCWLAALEFLMLRHRREQVKGSCSGRHSSTKDVLFVRCDIRAGLPTTWLLWRAQRARARTE